MPARPLFTIAPHAHFLDTLAARLLDGTLLGGWPRSGPFWLADVTVFLPTRRARLGLADALTRRGAGLLPDIRTFGGEAAEEEPFLPPFDAAPLPPPVARLERRGTLASLIAQWAATPAGAEAFASPPNLAETLALADSLGTLIDDLLIEGIDPSRLRALVNEENLAANWQQTLQFLEIALQAWPLILAERGRAEGADLRNQRLARQAINAPAIYGDRPVIAAGSTGSIPATAGLLKAIAALPRGAVVLPGLDTGLSTDQHQRLLSEREAPHGHPQYGLAKLLRHLGQTPANVVELADAASVRTLAVRRAFALARETASWVSDRAALADGLVAATNGMAILAARSEDEQARAIALAARQALVDGQSVGIICPDQNLSRRIAAELGRFDIAVDDPAGTPLYQSPAGRLLRQVLAAAASQFAAVDLVALLQNRAVGFDLGRATVGPLSQLLDLHVLRGRRLRPGAAGLRLALLGNADPAATRSADRLTPDQLIGIGTIIDRLETAFAPLLAVLAAPDIRIDALAGTLVDTVSLLVGDGAAEVPSYDDLMAWANEARALPPLCSSPANLDAVLAGLMAGFDVRNAQVRRQDIAIWGQLEARLQNRDFTILAGLNEDIWPRPADPGPWMSRAMRLDAGLEPPERDQGRAAHDLEMALGNGHLLLAYTERIGTSPALPSRFLQRLEAFLGTDLAKTLRARGQAYAAMAQALDAVPDVRAAQRPLPRPPAAARPRQLSITEVETLVRSPYDIYARHVLGLRAIDALGQDPGNRERGTMIHLVFARFVQEGHPFAAPDALARLMAMAEDAFAGLDAIAERRQIWLRRFALAAEHFIAFERARDASVQQRHAEIEGEWRFPNLEDFKLTGRADRVDQMRDGTLEIIDFKTGSIPATADMKAFLAPQLLLEAAMARAGGLKGISPADTGRLSYIKIGLGPDAFAETDFSIQDKTSLMQAAQEAANRLQSHVQTFLLSDHFAMTPRILPLAGQRYRGAYEHLARTDEWTLIAGDEP